MRRIAADTDGPSRAPRMADLKVQREATRSSDGQMRPNPAIGICCATGCASLHEVPSPRQGTDGLRRAAESRERRPTIAYQNHSPGALVPLREARKSILADTRRAAGRCRPSQGRCPPTVHTSQAPTGRNTRSLSDNFGLSQSSPRSPEVTFRAQAKPNFAQPSCDLSCLGYLHRHRNHINRPPHKCHPPQCRLPNTIGVRHLRDEHCDVVLPCLAR